MSSLRPFGALSSSKAEAKPYLYSCFAICSLSTLLETLGPAASLRLRIIAGGCSGMQYRMDLADAARPTDIVVAEQDVKVFVDPKSLTYLQGSKLEWEEDLFGGQFKITNPNAKHSCSCGLSFTI